MNKNEMEANEFRIGNLVSITNEALHYEGSPEDPVFEIAILEEDVVGFKGFHTREYYKHIKPIELTDGLLKLYGFEIEYTNSGSLRWQRDNFKLIDRRLPYPATNYHKNHITKLHQLQNLFFALTGKELELKHIHNVSNLVCSCNLNMTNVFHNRNCIKCGKKVI